jgi:quercetin dioxygenase-like cupin family protein
MAGVTARRTLVAAGCALLLATSSQSAAEQVKPLFASHLPNVDGKTLTVVEVDFAPGGTADPHQHGQAFVYAYVLTGAVRSQLAGEPARTFHKGQSWFEPPGADHVLTQNLSRHRPARLLVVFVADTGAALKIPDPKHDHEKDPTP